MRSIIAYFPIPGRNSTQKGAVTEEKRIKTLWDLDVILRREKSVLMWATPKGPTLRNKNLASLG